MSTHPEAEFVVVFPHRVVPHSRAGDRGERLPSDQYPRLLACERDVQPGEVCGEHRVHRECEVLDAATGEDDDGGVGPPGDLARDLVELGERSRHLQQNDRRAGEQFATERKASQLRSDSAGIRRQRGLPHQGILENPHASGAEVGRGTDRERAIVVVDRDDRSRGRSLDGSRCLIEDEPVTRVDREQIGRLHVRPAPQAVQVEVRHGRRALAVDTR